MLWSNECKVQDKVSSHILKKSPAMNKVSPAMNKEKAHYGPLPVKVAG